TNRHDLLVQAKYGTFARTGENGEQVAVFLEGAETFEARPVVFISESWLMRSVCPADSEQVGAFESGRLWVFIHRFAFHGFRRTNRTCRVLDRARLVCHELGFPQLRVAEVWFVPLAHHLFVPITGNT